MHQLPPRINHQIQPAFFKKIPAALTNTNYQGKTYKPRIFA